VPRRAQVRRIVGVGRGARRHEARPSHARCHDSGSRNHRGFGPKGGENGVARGGEGVATSPPPTARWKNARNAAVMSAVARRRGGTRGRRPTGARGEGRDGRTRGLRPRGARRSDGEEEREGSGRLERVRALREMNARVVAARRAGERRGGRARGQWPRRGRSSTTGSSRSSKRTRPADEHRPRAAPRRHG